MIILTSKNINDFQMIDVSHLMKFAGPQEKINKFKITNPTSQNFVYNFESLIDWNKVRNKNDLNNLIQQKIAILLKEKDKVLLKDINLQREIDILEERLAINQNNYEAQRTLSIYRNNPQQAKQQAIQEKNKERSEIVNGWIDYINSNDIYINKNPGFVYSAINAILNLPKDRIDPPPNVNPEVLAHTFDFIVQNPTKKIEFKSLYSNIASKIITQDRDVVTDERDGQWIRIKSQQNDPHNFEKNIKDLMNLSAGTGWCVAGDGMAKDYLSQGDFWLYYNEFKGKRKARIAIRLLGNKQISEVRGLLPGQELELGYEEIAEEFINKMNFSGGEQYKEKIKKNKEIFNKIRDIINRLNNGEELNKEDISFMQSSEDRELYFCKKAKNHPEFLVDKYQAKAIYYLSYGELDKFKNLDSIFKWSTEHKELYQQFFEDAEPKAIENAIYYLSYGKLDNFKNLDSIFEWTTEHKELYQQMFKKAEPKAIEKAIYYLSYGELDNFKNLDSIFKWSTEHKELYQQIFEKAEPTAKQNAIYYLSIGDFGSFDKLDSMFKWIGRKDEQFFKEVVPRAIEYAIRDLRGGDLNNFKKLDSIFKWSTEHRELYQQMLKKLEPEVRERAIRELKYGKLDYFKQLDSIFNFSSDPWFIAEFGDQYPEIFKKDIKPVEQSQPVQPVEQSQEIAANTWYNSYKIGRIYK